MCTGNFYDNFNVYEGFQGWKEELSLMLASLKCFKLISLAGKEFDTEFLKIL